MNAALPRPIPAYPMWATLPYTLLVLVIVPVYWRQYGPGNFLWFSDVAMFAVLVSLWTGNRMLYSMMAVGVLPFEIVWLVDFLTAGKLTGVAAYMFDQALPWWLRALSLFHVPLVLFLVWMLVRQGYERRALPLQIMLAWGLLPLTWWLTEPENNVNWVHGLGPDPVQIMPPLLYLALYMMLLPIVVYLPAHWLLLRLFASPGRAGG